MDNVPGLDSLPPGIQKILMQYEQRLRGVEERTADQVYDLTGFVDSLFKRRDRKDMHRTAETSMYKGWVVDTLDPRKQGRVRFFSPYLHEPGTKIDALPFAEPISWCGGFDDCGVVWVPPAGSTLLVIFEAASSHTPYYLGTMWPRDRGPEGNHYWNAVLDGIPEFDEIHSGHRKGYFHGPKANPNDESQVLPPWNTENYDSFDWDGQTPPEPADPTKVAYPFIMGFKTPQKHMIKFVDGDYRCFHRYKRLEILSSLGNYMLFKDDHLHEGARWANPHCKVFSPTDPGSPINCGCAEPPWPYNINDHSCHVDCVNSMGQPLEVPDCKLYEVEGRDKYFKHKNECRPCRGPYTPQNNRIALPQCGLQFMSISGHTIFFDDSVEEPSGEPKWERVLEPFSFGCTNVFIGKAMWKSTTGHRVEINDEEKYHLPMIRGRQVPIEKPCDMTYDPWKRPNDYTNETRRNGILLLTACGQRLEMNDDTTPGGKGDVKRSIFMQSTSNHTFEMNDYTVENPIVPRREGGVPLPNAHYAFVRIRSGYGLEIDMHDNHSQEHCEEQYIQITAPQKGYKDKEGCCAGPHFVRMQCFPDCGYIFVRAAGDYIRITAGHEVVVVGDDCLGPKNKFLRVSDNYVVSVENVYLNFARMHVFLAKEYILLIAGPPCTDNNDATKCCVYPVATMAFAAFCPIVRGRVCLDPRSFSDRVFCSNLHDCD